MRNALVLALLSLVLESLVLLAQDLRNVEVPHPNYHFDFQPPKTLEAWKKRREELRSQILAAAGLYPLSPRPRVNVIVTRRRTQPEYRIWTMLVETFPGFYVGAELYLPPASMPGPYPAVLSPHGHWKQGRLTHREDYSVPALGINLAAQGYVVLAWDMVGYNDARQLPHDFISRKRQLWGFSPLGLQLWNTLRMVDYLEALPEADRTRIAITGASGGGTQTFLAAAVDERIRVSAPVNMISASMQGGDPCEEAPNLRLESNNVEFAALMAPRPQLIVSSTGDWTKNTPTDEFPRVQAIYELFGAKAQVMNAHFDAGHNYNKASREVVYRFLARQFQPKAEAGEKISFEVIQARHKEDLLEMPRQVLPSNALPEAELDVAFQNWVQRENKELAGRDKTMQRERLRMMLGVRLPATVAGNVSGNTIRFQRVGRDVFVEGLRQAGERGTVIIVHPESAQLGFQSKQAERWRKEGYTVVALEPFHPSRERELHRRADRWFSSYNQSDAAIRIEDLLTAVRYVQGESKTRPRLVGIGDATLWCHAAAALSPWPVAVEGEPANFAGTDEELLERFFLPNLQRANGWKAIQKLAHD